MKILPRFVAIAAVAVLLGFAAGCTSPEDDNLLVRAGFDAVRANTTAQLEVAQKLNPYQILVVQKNGRTFYVFPDPVHGQIYVGTEKDFARYRSLRSHQNSKVREADLPLVENHGAAILHAWADWPGWNA